MHCQHPKQAEKLKSREMKDERWRNDKEWKMKNGFADKQTDGQTDISDRY